MSSSRKQQKETYYFCDGEEVSSTYTILKTRIHRFVQLTEKQIEQVFTKDKIPVTKNSSKITKQVNKKTSISPCAKSTRTTSLAKLNDCHIGQLFSSTQSQTAPLRIEAYPTMQSKVPSPEIGAYSGMASLPEINALPQIKAYPRDEAFSLWKQAADDSQLEHIVLSPSSTTPDSEAAALLANELQQACFSP